LTANVQENPQPAANSGRSALPDFPEFLRQIRQFGIAADDHFREDRRFAFNLPLTIASINRAALAASAA
jgi:hypothetical protein